MAKEKMTKTGIKPMRDSNVELLRLLCMLMVLMHHMLLKGPKVAGFSIDYSVLTNDVKIASFLNQFFYCAVDVFILISGYYGIKSKVKGVVNLYVKCTWWSSLCYFAYLLWTGGSLGRWGLTHNCVFTLSNARWFIASYICLYLIAPILNMTIERMTKYQFRKWLVILFVINVYLGWFWGNSVNYKGYNVANFIFLYYIGRYLNHYCPVHESKRFLYVIVYLSCAILLGCVGAYGSWKEVTDLNYSLTEKYNNPILIIESIALLYVFLTIRVQSRFINWLATSVLAVYLIHQNPYVDEWITDYLNSHFYSWGESIRWLFLVLFSLGIYVSCLLLDKLSAVLYQPLSRWLLHWVDKGYAFLQKIMRANC